MKTYLVGYDLNRPGQNYDSLIKALQAYPNWWHHLDSTWVIKTDWTAVQIRDDLLPHIDKNDELLVVRLNGEGA
ncbi:MAG: SinR family protein [Pyrinomonadaceae bacterium]